MDLDISMRSGDCPYTVQFYGALFRDGDVWICMEVMETSLDKFYPKVFDTGSKFPEEYIGKIAYAVSSNHSGKDLQNFLESYSCYKLQYAIVNFGLLILSFNVKID